MLAMGTFLNDALVAPNNAKKPKVDPRELSVYNDPLITQLL
jgi:hypothetical protein